jgi:alpha-amylase
MGFSGFRIDAAKHISPPNLAAIFAKFKKNLGGSIPEDFITYLEVIIGG